MGGMNYDDFIRPFFYLMKWSKTKQYSDVNQEGLRRIIVQRSWNFKIEQLKLIVQSTESNEYPEDMALWIALKREIDALRLQKSCSKFVWFGRLIFETEKSTNMVSQIKSSLLV